MAITRTPTNRRISVRRGTAWPLALSPMAVFQSGE
jgi:hypothetical protein